MSENESTFEPDLNMDGQSDANPDEHQASMQEPEPNNIGQSIENEQADGTTEPKHRPQKALADDDSFFDPRTIQDKPELMSAYKSMQAAYTRKMQGIKSSQQKIDAYDAFQASPREQMQNILSQWGMRMVPIGSSGDGKSDENIPDDYQPKDWQDAFNRGAEIAERRIMQKLAPMMSRLHNLQEDAVKSKLFEIDPGWQRYEEEMKTNLQRHPSLSEDPSLLYRMSVPPEVLESRAVQIALKRLEAQGKSASVSGSSTTNKNPASGLPDKPVSFDEAVNAARKVLQEQGIRKPS